MFRLALAFGCTVEELKSRLSSSEFTQWIAFYGLEPWGFEVSNYQFGLLSSVVANANRAPNQPPFKPSDFMRQERKVQTFQEQIALMKSLGAGRGN